MRGSCSRFVFAGRGGLVDTSDDAGAAVDGYNVDDGLSSKTI